MFLVYGCNVKLNAFMVLANKLNLWIPKWELVPIVAIFIIWVNKAYECVLDAAPKSHFLHLTYKRRMLSASRRVTQYRFSRPECSTMSPFWSCPSFNLQCHEHQECTTGVDQQMCMQMCTKGRRGAGMVFPVPRGRGVEEELKAHGCQMERWHFFCSSLVSPQLPTHRPGGSSRNLGSTGSGHSSSSCAGSTGTSRSPPARRRGRSPGSPGRQTPTLEGCTKKSTRGSPPSGHGIHGWASPCKRGEWEGPGEERTSSQVGEAPDSRRTRGDKC